MREGAHHDRKTMTMQLQVNTSISSPGMNMRPEKSHFFMIEITLHMRHFTERIESFELMSCCFIIQVLKKILGILAELCCLSISNQGKPPVAPLHLRHFPGPADVRKDLQDARALRENQVEPGGVPRAPPLPAVVFVPVTAAQSSTGTPLQRQTSSSVGSWD